MTSLGEKLRRERQQTRISLEEISARTKIGVRMLEAIETEQFEKLPGGVFRKSFVLQYAKALGLDPAVIEEDLKHHSQFDEQPSIPGQETPRLGSDMGSIQPYLPRRDWAELLGGSFGALLAAVAVILGCAGVYSWLNRPPSAAPTVSASPAVEPIPIPPANAAQRGMSADLPPAAPGTPAQSVAASGSAVLGQSVRVDLKAGEDTWISAFADGRRVFSDSLRPQQTKMVEGVGKVRLLIGNAGGVEVSLNGKPIGPIGPRGQVRVVELTPEGFQVVSRKPLTPEPL